MAPKEIPPEIKSARERFTRELHEEHFEEASFLYTQRYAILEDSTLGWQDVEDTEKRLENHLAPLQHVSEIEPFDPADPGQVYVALRVACREQNLSGVCAILEQVKASASAPPQPQASADLHIVDAAGHPEMSPTSASADGAKTAEAEAELDRCKAIYDAFKIGFPESWSSRLAELPINGDPFLLDALWRVSGFRHWKRVQGVLPVPSQPSPGFCFHAGRTGNSNALMVLNRALSDSSESIKCEAAIAILRLGNRDFLRLLNPGPVPPWVAIPLGIGGDKVQADALARIPVQEQTKESILALGLHGCPAAIHPLIQALADEGLAENTALALNLITGANLKEKIFIPDEIKEDELLEEEKEKLKKGEPLYPPGQEPGMNIIRLSQKADDWIKWWKINQKRFDPKLRWRRGKPISPQVMVEYLSDPQSPAFLRSIVYEELVIRYGVKIPFEPDMPIATQLPIIEQLRNWAMSPPQTFEPGQWYFAGGLNKV